jgi:hypothetical protein
MMGVSACPETISKTAAKHVYYTKMYVGKFNGNFSTSK